MDAGYTVCSFYENSLDCTLKMYVPFCVYNILRKKSYKVKQFMENISKAIQLMVYDYVVLVYDYVKVFKNN